MTRFLRSTSLSVCFVASLFLTASCSQDSGESCQTNSNCADGLICCKSDTAERGFCGKKSDMECGGGTTEDVTDSGAVDAAMSLDASSSEDSGPADAAMSVSEDGGGDGG